jgi:hypothetical protein
LLRGQEQHRQRLPALSQTMDHFQTVKTGHADIQNSHRIAFSLQQMVGRTPVAHAVHGKASCTSAFSSQ